MYKGPYHAYRGGGDNVVGLCNFDFSLELHLWILLEFKVSFCHFIMTRVYTSYLAVTQHDDNYGAFSKYISEYTLYIDHYTIYVMLANVLTIVESLKGQLFHCY